MNEEWLIQASHKRILLHKKCRFINLVDAKLVALKACRNSISVDFSHHTHGWRRRKFTEGTEGINVQCEISATCHRQNTVMKKKEQTSGSSWERSFKNSQFWTPLSGPALWPLPLFRSLREGWENGMVVKGMGGLPSYPGNNNEGIAW